MIKYTLYSSLSANIATVADMEANGKIEDIGTDAGKLKVTGRPQNTEIFVNILAEYQGSKIAYQMRSQTTAEAPPAPGNNGVITTSDVTHKQIRIGWVKATDLNHDDSLLVHRLYWSDENNISTVADAEANGTLLAQGDIDEYLHENLNHITEYFYQVVVENPNELKSAYQMTSDVTAPANPVPAGDITFSGITTSGFTANWEEATDPEYTHAQLTYRVYSSEDPDIDSIANAEANGVLEVESDGIISRDFTDLGDGQTVYLSIVIENPDGLKGFYNMAEVTTEEDITIGSSVNISSISEDSDGVLIGYHELDEFGDGPGEGYELEIVNQGNPADTQIVDISGNNPSYVTGLDEGTTYTFQARAYNLGGPGPFGGLEVYTTMVKGAWSETETWEVV